MTLRHRPAGLPGGADQKEQLVMSTEEYDAWQAGLAQMHAAYEEADRVEYVAFMDELDARDVRRWADSLLAGPAAGGAELEQRHVLDEAAHPDLVAAFRRLAPTA